jgi:putative CocE/NonD family hydrolase
MPQQNGVSSSDVQMRWGVKIPLRDGVHLNATLYLPASTAASPAIFTLTPYVGQSYHDRGVYFATHGYPFLTVDVRGRGNSEGVFRPAINEARDGFDVAEWLAGQPYCNGKVTMWGGSYAGYNQWATAKEFPPNLMTIVPVASPYMGVDFPIRNNITAPYFIQWLTLVAGRTSQDKIFAEQPFWTNQFRRWFESGVAFRELDAAVGNPSEVFQEWLAHPESSTYWDAFNPTADQYARISIPVLTITGIYDGDQPGALAHHREHLKNTSAAARERHFLVIGPWDHAGTRTPRKEFGGIKVGEESLVDLQQLHLQWYAWTMQGGPKPEFLRKKVAYYVMGADKWRYADTLEAVTTHWRPLYLDSAGTASHIYASGTLGNEIGTSSGDTYLYDPRDISIAKREAALSDPLCLRPTFPTDNLRDQTLLFANEGKQLIYHSVPFSKQIEICGFFKLLAWISIDQADTDFSVCIYEIGVDGGSILLSCDWMRARYRRGLREAKLIGTQEPLRYDFDRFTFVSRQIATGSRLRLVIGPINSIHSQKNYNSGGVVSEESMKDARPVKVTLLHDHSHPSVLHVPFGHSEP